MYQYLKKLVIKGIVTAFATSTMINLINPLTSINAQEPIEIGILQYVEHESLNQNYQGFLNGLKEAGYVEGENLQINFLNASGDTANLQTMSENVVNGSDYIFAIATPAAQAIANVEKEKPIFISSVSDPVSAGLVKSTENPETNVTGNLTGTMDAGPLREQVSLIKEVAPQAKKVGILYNSGEANAVSEAEIAREILEATDYEVSEATITSTNDISQVMGNLVNEVEVVFIVTDNTIASAMSLVGDLATDANIPLVGGSKDMVLENGLITYGLDYYKLGEQTAEMLVRMIEEDLQVGEMALEKPRDLELVINEKNAEKLGIDPDSIQDPSAN